jgi:hypothetical protein
MKKLFWILTSVLCMCIMFMGCKESKPETPVSVTSSPKIVPKVQKNLERCRILKSHISTNVRADISTHCFEVKSDFYHLAMLFPSAKARLASRDSWNFVRKVFGKSGLKLIFSQKASVVGGEMYILLVFRIISDNEPMF